MERLTRERIVALEGRELDAAVAERVMGLRVRNGQVFSHYEEDEFEEVSAVWVPVPRYSSDIAAAWQVVECLRDSYGFGLYLEYDWGEPHAQARISNINAPGWEATADTVPVAICRAALLAVMGEREA